MPDIISKFKKAARSLSKKAVIPITVATALGASALLPSVAFAENCPPPPPPQQQSICVESCSYSYSYINTGNNYCDDGHHHYYDDHWYDDDDHYYYCDENSHHHHYHSNIDTIAERDDAYQTFIGVYYDKNKTYSNDKVVALFGDEDNDYNALGKKGIDKRIEDLKEQKEEYTDADETVPKWIDKELKALRDARDDVKYYLDNPGKVSKLETIEHKLRNLSEPSHPSSTHSSSNYTVTVTTNGNTTTYTYHF